MNEATARLLQLDDPRLPAMRPLLGLEAADVLSAAVGGEGKHVVEAKPQQVTWRTGRSLFVSYEATVAAKGQRDRDFFIAATGQAMPAGATVLGRGDARVAVWRMADDPALPGFAVALDPRAARGLLDGVGAPAGPVAARVRAYRPCRRAVVELSVGHFRIFAKVVPPAQVPALQERHRVIAQHLPVPRSHGWSSELGLVLLAALPGATLRSALMDHREPVPPPQQIAALLDFLPDVGDGAITHSPVNGVREHTGLIRRIIPELGERLDALRETLSQGEAEPGPRVPVHGDLHEAQLLTDGGRISGLLDVDTAGLGYRIDDWAGFLGHLITWGAFAPHSARKRINTFVRQTLELADEQIGQPAELRRRVSCVILGVATGPFRAQTRNWPAETRARIALAERWAATSAEMDKSGLIAASL